jgi:hypothetical protein
MDILWIAASFLVLCGVLELSSVVALRLLHEREKEEIYPFF